MKVFKLHYAYISLYKEDIPTYEFRNHSQMVNFIDKQCIHRKGTVVWLIAKDESSDIFISESYLSIQDYLSTKMNWQVPCNYFLQEYPSFEEAYSVALDMAEISDLCYSKVMKVIK